MKAITYEESVNSLANVVCFLRIILLLLAEISYKMLARRGLQDQTDMHVCLVM